MRRPNYQIVCEQLIALRKAHPALQQGGVQWIANAFPDRLLTFERSTVDQTIAVSADTEAHASGKCRAAGMDDFLPKPVSLDRLAATLRRWVGGAGLAMP